MAQKKKKKTSITVDKDDFEEQLRNQLDSVTYSFDVPRGLFLSRGIYLACKEFNQAMCGEQHMPMKVDLMRDFARKSGLPFKEEVFLDTDAWMDHLQELRKRALHND